MDFSRDSFSTLIYIIYIIEYIDVMKHHRFAQVFHYLAVANWGRSNFGAMMYWGVRVKYLLGVGKMEGTLI